MEREINGELLNIPEHVAIIMDGNGKMGKETLDATEFRSCRGSKSDRKSLVKMRMNWESNI